MKTLPLSPNYTLFHPTIAAQVTHKTCFVTCSLHSLLVYGPDFTVIHSLQVDAPIRCLSVFKDKIAFATKDGLYLAQGGDTLNILIKLPIRDIQFLDYDQNGLLLVGCAQLLVLEDDKTVMEIPLPSVPLKAQWSPNQQFIGVLFQEYPYFLAFYCRPLNGQCGWNGKSLLDLCTIGSYSPILDFSWRPSGERQVLLTSSHSRSRLWEMTSFGPEGQFCRFDLASVIDYDNLSPIVSTERLSAMHVDVVEKVHWLSGPAFTAAVEGQTKNMMLKDAAAEYPDMLFQINQKGCLLIWGIKGLGTHPQTSTHVQLLFKTNPLFLQDALFFSKYVSNPFSIVSTSKPVLYFLSACQNQARCYGFDLDDFFTKAWISPRLQILFEWEGPQEPFTSILRHPLLPYFYMTTDSGASVYYFETFGTRDERGMAHYCVVPKCDLFCWNPKQVSAFVYADGKVFLFDFDGLLGMKRQLLFESEPLVNLQCFSSSDTVYLVIQTHKTVVYTMKDTEIVEQQEISVNGKILGLDTFYRPFESRPLSFYVLNEQGIDYFDDKQRSILSLKMEQVKISSLGMIACRSKDQVIIYWNNTLQMHLRELSKIPLDQIFVDMQWHTTEYGYQVLCIVLEHKIRVYYLGRQEMQLFQEFEFKDKIRSLTWLPDSTLFVSTSLMVSLLNLNEDRSLVLKTWEGSGRLPDHHPLLLMQYVIAEKYDLVKYNLSVLHLFTSLGHVQVPMALWALLGLDADPTAKEDKEQLFSDDLEQKKSSLVFTEDKAQYLIGHLQDFDQETNQKLKSFISTFKELDQFVKSMDTNASRYLLSAKMALGSGQVTTRDACFAFFSDSQDTLLNLISQSSKLVWPTCKQLGLGWWIRNPETLKKQAEIIARAQFQPRDDTRDPPACSLFYLALKRKNVLLGLWKVSNHPEQQMMLKFLQNDFEQERWQNAAMKNAFALLGKQRYEYAVSFFLLAGKLKDAVNVCMKQLQDPQLAILICRLYEGEEGPVLKELIVNQLIPQAIEDGDRWQLCMLYTLVKDLKKAFYCVCRPLKSLDEPSNEILQVNDPAIMYLYEHLKKVYKTLIMESHPSLDPKEEHDLLLQCASQYERLGCHSLALDIIHQHQLESLQDVQLLEEATAVALDAQVSENANSGGLEWGEPEKPKSTGLDWGELETTIPKNTGLDWGEMEQPKSTGLDWGEMEQPKSTGLDWGEMETTKSTGLDWGEMESTIPEVETHTFVSVKPQEPRKVTKDELEQIERNRRQLLYYKWLLGLRTVQSLPLSCATVVKYQNELQDTLFKDYFSLIKSSMNLLIERTGLDPKTIDKVFEQSCIESLDLNAFIALNRCFDFRLIENADNLFISYILQLSIKALQQETEKTDLRIVQAIKQFVNLDLENKTVIFVGAGSFIMHFYCCCQLRRQNSIWWMLGMAEKLFDHLLKENKSGLFQLLKDVLTEREPLQHLDDQELPESELYDEYGVALYKKDSKQAMLCVEMVLHLALEYLVNLLVRFVERVKEIVNVHPDMYSLVSFLADDLQRPLELELQARSESIELKWQEYKMHTKSIPAYLLDTEWSQVWLLLQRIGDAQERIKHLPHDQETEEQETLETETVYITQDQVIGFCFNPLERDTLAFASGNIVREIQVSQSLEFFKEKKAVGSSEDLLMPPVMQKETSWEKVLKRAFTPNQPKYNDKGVRLKRKMHGITSMESHHSLNYYLAGCGTTGTSEVSVQLFQFGEFRELVEYSALSDGSLTRMHFDPFGVQFGAGDTRGSLHLFRFDAQQSSRKPHLSIKAYTTSGINDFTFVNSSTILGTAGIAVNKMNVSIFDTLLPPHQMKIKSFLVGDEGINSIVYCPDSYMLIAGGRKGCIFTMDMRQGYSFVNQVQAHDHAIRTLHVKNSTLVSGSVRGEIKVWDLKSDLKMTKQLPLMSDLLHPYAVVDLKLKDKYLYSCWTDGAVRRTPL
ncbi:RAVE protein 1 C terminal-domain-containing protein [Gorgonomyces haynaldii]|nr:RAVE protein 1 C terminal-domain-containing protein [Gorgonomyces haynaldii]